MTINTFCVILLCFLSQVDLSAQEFYHSEEFKEIQVDRKEIDYSKNESVSEFIEKWEAKALASGDSMAIAYVWMTAGRSLSTMKMWAEAESYALKAGGIISRHELKNKFNYNKSYLASIKATSGQFESGIELALQSVDEFERSDPYGNKLNYHVLADAYLSLHNYERMDHYLQKWYDLVKEKDIRMHLGFAIYNMHEFYDIAGMYDKASYYQNEFYKFYAESGDEISHIPEHAFITITGETPEESIIKLQKYLPFHIKNDRKYFVSQTNRHLGRLYLEIGKPDSAIVFFEKAVKLNSNVIIENQVDGLSGLSEAYGLVGNYESAFLNSNRYIKLIDSFKNMQVIDQANELEAKYENEKKELQLELKESQIQAKNRWLLLSAVAGLLVLGLAGFILFLYQKLKSTNKILSKTVSEKETLLQEIHHRVKNNLQVISSLLSLQSKYVKDENAISALNEGQNRVESMALIHQNLYREDNISGVNMKTYIPLLANKIFESYNIHGDGIRIEYEIDEISLDVETVIPIGLVMNELISNALKYAFPNQQEGVIRIDLLEKSNGLMISVSDDGVGMKIQDEESGFGTKLIRSFARKLEGEISVNSEKGTAVKILIKNFKRA